MIGGKPPVGSQLGGVETVTTRSPEKLNQHRREKQMKRVNINLTFSADLDQVRGWGFDPQDWVALIQSELMRNAHYHPRLEVHSVTIEAKQPA
jgi:hypothetical protein